MVMIIECTHKQLARSCELCEKDARIVELQAELDKFYPCHPYSYCGPNGGSEHLEIRRSNITARTVYHKREV